MPRTLVEDPCGYQGVVKAYTVELEDGRVVRRHVDHVLGRTLPDRMPPGAGTPDKVFPVEFQTPVPDPPESPARSQQLCDVPPTSVKLQSVLEFRCMTLN